MKGEEMNKAMKKVRDFGCKKEDCKNCALYTDECVYNFLNRVHKWQEQQHKEFEKFTNEYEG